MAEAVHREILTATMIESVVAACVALGSRVVALDIDPRKSAAFRKCLENKLVLIKASYSMSN